jgi:hypothetical protein
LIHIGCHKTASSWLPEHLFSGRHASFRPVAARYEGRKHLVEPESLEDSARTVGTALQPQIEAIARAGCIAVISDERLSGNPHSGGYDSREIADRLRSTSPIARS